MKILHIVSSINPESGGVSQAVRSLVPELKKLGVNSEVLCLDDPDADFLKADDFPVHALGAAKGPWAYHAALQPWLKAHLYRFDAIMLHGLWLYPGYALRKAIKAYHKNHPKHQIDYWVMPHGMLDPYFQQAPGRKLKAIRNWFYWKWIEEKVIQDASGILFTSEEEMRLAATTFSPYRPQAVHNIGYGIADPPVYQQSMQQAFYARCPELKEQAYFLFLGRIHPKKGVNLLLAAYEQILAETPDKQHLSDLVIAGPGLESTYGREMQTQVKQSPLLQNRVHFPGMLNGEAKWGAIYSSDAFVLPSHQENFGIAVVEALACGKAVLISDQVNIWREIEQAGAGLVAAATLAGTRTNLQFYLDLNQSEKGQMQIAAKRAYEQFFRVEQAAVRLLACITK